MLRRKRLRKKAQNVPKVLEDHQEEKVNITFFKDWILAARKMFKNCISKITQGKIKLKLINCSNFKVYE